MNTSKMLKIARAAGIGAAILVPAWVVAQTLPNFAPGNLLRAQDLQDLRSNLDGRIRALEGRPANPSAPNLVVSVGAPANALASSPVSASAACSTGVAVSCSCESTGTFTRLLDVVLSNGTCFCQYFNEDLTRTTTVTASANCLTLR